LLVIFELVFADSEFLMFCMNLWLLLMILHVLHFLAGVGGMDFCLFDRFSVGGGGSKSAVSVEFSFSIVAPQC
jgi:hypothetical protein